MYNELCETEVNVKNLIEGMERGDRRIMLESIIRLFPESIRFMSQQPDQLCLLAVSIDGTAIKYVKNQTKEMCLIALEQNVESLEYIVDKTQVYDKAVDANPFMLECVPVEHQTVDMCTKAVITNGLALQHCQIQSYDICIHAIESNPMALEYVYDKTHELCKLAVSKNGLALGFIENPSEEICRIAIANNYFAERLIKR